MYCVTFLSIQLSLKDKALADKTINKVQNFNLNKNINNDSIYFRIIFSAMGLVSLSVVEELICEKSMTRSIII
jgi:hypothetical protein